MRKRYVRRSPASRLPQAARFGLTELANQIEGAKERIEKLERAIVMEAKHDDDMRRLATIPGVGAIIAVSIKALVPDPGGSKSGRHFAAWLGLTPKPHSSGGKVRLGRISKMGNSTLRSLLILGATSVLGHVRRSSNASKWVTATGTTPLQGSCNCSRQQNGAHHLGASHQRRNI